MNVNPEFESVCIPIERQVRLSGSSIYAVLYGPEIWEAAYRFLENKSAKGKQGVSRGFISKRCNIDAGL